jgi:hypothetical protein
MTRHTPGPWYALLDNCGGGRNIGIEHKGRFIGIAHTGAVRAPMTLAGREPIEDDEAKANARLIAAAPTMLAALERLDLTMLAPGKNAPSPYGTFNEDDAEAIRTAITKAKGDLQP